MKLQSADPNYEHEPDLCAQVVGIARDLEENLGAGVALTDSCKIKTVSLPTGTIFGSGYNAFSIFLS